MFRQMCESLHVNSSKLAYIYHNDNVLYSKTYKDINEELEQISDFFSQIPSGVVIAVQVGKHFCLLPVVYSLLQYKIAFVLLDECDTIDSYIQINVAFFAIITCNSHEKGSQSLDSKEFDRSFVQCTKSGCSYKMKTFKLSVEEKASSLSYKGICYIITTSGTMGKKKLVKVTENAIYSNIKSFIKLFGITCDDVIYFGTSLAFDPCYVELLLALTTGCCLVTTSKEMRNNSQKLLNALFSCKNLVSSGVTFMQMCPLVFTQFTSKQIDFLLFESSLRTLSLGGEQFPNHVIPVKIPSLCKIYNLYGITEISCWASVERVIIGEKVGLGTPIDETIFKIETNDGFVNVANNFKSDVHYEGLLHIGSKSRLCYINDEEPETLDNLIFRNTGDLVKLENGKLFYIGRMNDVIKRFGQRISLLKVQELIYLSTQLPNQCIFHKEKMFCFLKLPQHNENSLKDNNMRNEWNNKIIDKIRVQLLKTIAPEYFPDYFRVIEEFPVLHHNGKLDKKRLQEIADCDLEKQKLIKMTCTKKVFYTLWCKYIGILETELEEAKLYTCNFWDSGGTSIAAMQLANEYQSVTKCPLNRSVLDLQFKEALNFIESDMKVNQSNSWVQNSSHFKVLWKANLKACVDSSPIICDINGRIVVAIGNFAQRFAVFDAITGREIASIAFPNVIESETLYCDSYFYVPCFDGHLHCLQLNMACRIDGTSENVHRVWTFQTGDRLKSKPVIFNNNILFGSYDGYVYSVTKGGLLSWKTRIGEPITTEVKYYKEKIYLSTLKGSFLAISYTLIVWRYKALNPIFTPPEISIENDSVLFLDIQGKIYCVSISNDSILWTFDSSPCKTFGSMAILGNQIYLGTEKGTINMYMFNISKCSVGGQLIVESNLATITTKPLLFNLIDKNYLLVVNSVGCIQLYCITDVTDSNIIDQPSVDFAQLLGIYLLPNECFSSPQISLACGNRVYLGCRDNNLYCFEIKVV